jgi:hypothetical protein
MAFRNLDCGIRLAIHKAFTEQIFTDEINLPPTRP